MPNEREPDQLLVEYRLQWTCQKREPWQRIPIRFTLTDPESRLIDTAEEIEELIARHPDRIASWEGNKPAPLAELAEVFEAPKTGKCRQCGSPCVESDHRCDSCIDSD